MKKYIFILILLIIFSSCKRNHREIDEKSNIMNDEVVVQAIRDNVVNYNDWTIYDDSILVNDISNVEIIPINHVFVLISNSDKIEYKLPIDLNTKIENAIELLKNNKSKDKIRKIVKTLE